MAWTEAQRLKGQETQRRNRAAKKAYQDSQKSSGGVVGTQPVAVAGVVEPDSIATGAGDKELKVTVKAPEATPPHKPTLRERLGLGGGPKQAAPIPAKRKGKKDDIAISSVIPPMVALLIATIARDRVADEYKACAPTQQEVQLIILPLMNIISRRLEITGQVSQDAVDMANSITYMVAYSVRAYVTYVDIKKAKEAHEQPKQQQSARDARLEQERRDYAEVASDPEQTLARGLRAYQAQASGTNQPAPGEYANGYAAAGGARPANAGASSNGSTNPDDDKQLRDREAALVSEMFKRDREGRVGLGLLPRTV